MTETELSQKVERAYQHQMAGRNAQAVALLDSLIDDHGEQPRLLHFKGLNLLALGQKQEGLSLLETALAAVPDDGVQLADFGTVLVQKTSEQERGLAMLEKAVEVQPDYGLAHGNLGALLLLNGDTERAQTHLEKAVALDGNLVDPLTNLAQIFIDKSEFKRAVDLLFRALALAPNLPLAHGRLSRALIELGRYDAAEYHARRVLELDSGSANARLLLARVCAFKGALDEATDLFRGLADDPNLGTGALVQLIHLRKTVPESEDLQRLNDMLAKMDTLPEGSRNSLHFAAAKANDDLGNWDVAFDHITKGNKGTVTDTTQNLENFLARSARVREMCDPAFINRLAGSGLKGTDPIFVCGMPRSGTTLVEQMLSRHPALSAGGELSALPRAVASHMRLRAAVEETIDPATITADDMSVLGERYLEQVRKEDILAQRFTDKMPINYNFAALAALALPDARFVILRRHPLDCILSNYFQNFGKNQPYSTSLVSLAKVYDNFAKTADQWLQMLPDQVVQLNYEDLLVDPEQQLRKVLDISGLDWDEAVLDHTAARNAVRTASIVQVREPIYKSAQSRWVPYARHFQPLLEYLAPYLSAEDIDKVEMSASA